MQALPPRTGAKPAKTIATQQRTPTSGTGPRIDRGAIVMARFTRGFAGRGRANRDPRLPPGQYDTGKSWPVLTAEVTPRIDTATWTFRISGLVDRPTTWTWDEMHALPPST